MSVLIKGPQNIVEYSVGNDDVRLSMQALSGVTK
jgi:hypothetical protein